MTSTPAPPTADDQHLAVRRTKRDFILSPNGDRIAKIQAIIAGAQRDPAIAGPLAEHGYGPTRLAEGQRLYEAALELFGRHRAHQQSRRSATLAYQTAVTSAQVAVGQVYKLARLAFKDQQFVMFLLGLDTEFNNEFREEPSDWREDARSFYSVLLTQPSLLHQLAMFGVRERHLRDGLQLLAVVNTTVAIARREISAADAVMHSRNLALADLDIWYAEFVAVARQVFAAQPQLLQQLVIPPR